MSRSRKKNPVYGWACAASDRPFKKIRRATFRAQERQLLITALGDPDADLDFDQQYWDSWASNKDGKIWDPSRPELMRK